MPKELSEVINQRRTGNAMANRKRKKMIHSLIKTTQKTEDWVARIPLKTLSDDLFLCQVSKGSTVRFEFKKFCTLVTMATVAILNFFQPPQKLPHTTKFHEVWRKESKLFLNPPFFCFHGNCGKVCPTDSDFFDLSRSTRCGCCSYQVSSISVWRVTCYDHFCVFQFFSILAVSMATVAI